MIRQLLIEGLLTNKLEDTMIFSYSEEDEAIQVKVDDASYLDNIVNFVSILTKKEKHV